MHLRLLGTGLLVFVLLCLAGLVLFPAEPSSAVTITPTLLPFPAATEPGITTTVTLTISVTVPALQPPSEVTVTAPLTIPESVVVLPKENIFSQAVLDLLEESPDTDQVASVFIRGISPLIREAKQRREADPDYFFLSDWELNQNRLNILLFGYGETHEPPATEFAVIGSPSLISLDIPSGRLTEISITHDVRAPEVEVAAGILGKPGSVLRLDMAYLEPRVGSLKLLRKVIASATGLYPDYIIVFSDVVIKDLVDDVFNGIEITVSKSFAVQPFYLLGKKYPEGIFEKGVQRFDGKRAIQYIKTVPKAEAYPPDLEHNVRKRQVLKALEQELRKKRADPGFWIRLSLFPKKELDEKKVMYDFDHMLLVNSLPSLGRGLVVGLAAGKKVDASWPVLWLSHYIVDKSCSLDPNEEAVRWVSREATDPFIRQDFASGVYQSGLGIEVPYGANPYGKDLPREYWQSLRQTVRRIVGEAEK